MLVYEGITPVVWKGTLGGSEMILCKTSNVHFLDALPISSETWILKTYDQKLSQIILAKKAVFSVREPGGRYVMEKAGDGIFSPDGSLEYNRDSTHIFFTYYYRNRFDCLDTNLRLLYSAKTIDTIQHPTVKVLVDEKNKMTSVAGTAVLVNKLSASDGRYLFVQSGLLANNENREIFDRASVVDIYEESNGKYRYSFYIPHFQEESLKGFQVKRNDLLALYEHYLVLYHLNYLSD